MKKCLLIGGPANGKVFQIKAGISVMIQENGNTFQYYPTYFRCNDYIFEVFIHGDKPEDIVIYRMIKEADLKPIHTFDPINPDEKNFRSENPGFR